MLLLIAIILLWLIVGATGFIYWWTREYDLTVDEIIIVIMVSIAGPISWLYGYFIHGKRSKKSEQKFLLKRKTKK